VQPATFEYLRQRDVPVRDADQAHARLAELVERGACILERVKADRVHHRLDGHLAVELPGEDVGTAGAERLE
jgi:hypothetical protein